MAHTSVLLACLWALLAVATSEKEQSRWSRQISSYTSDISDWVPLTGPIEREPIPQPLPPIKRQAVAEPRILTEPFPGFTRPSGFSQDAFPPRNFFNSPANRQLYLQSVPSAPQNYLTEQGFGQSIRFGLSQPNFPLSQGFIAPPQFGYETIPAGPPQIKPRPQPAQPASPTKFDGFVKQSLPSAQAKPFVSQPIRTKPELPKFVDGYRVENITNDFTSNQKRKVQSSQKIKFENYDKIPKLETVHSKPKVEREEVQLLYVPLESLNRGQFNFRTPIAQPQVVNTELYSQSLPKPNTSKHVFSNDVQKPQAKPIDSLNSNQNYYSNIEVVKDDQVPKYSIISPPFATAPPTTPKPKKLKPHQPPLAIFMTQDARKGHQLKVGDVLTTLKNANTIAVLDTVNPVNAPKVFIGPSSLKSSDNFVKFELPYLSNIENSDKKLRQLPFFVAPLSYKTPNGFAKIPFPSPHVGSVVINSLIRETASAAHSSYPTQSTPTTNVIPNSYSAMPREQKIVTQKPNFSYYSTSAPSTNNLESERQRLSYYSIEPQTVTAIPTQKEPNTNVNAVPSKTGSYFLTNVGTQYNPTKYVNLQTPAKQQPINQYFARPETTTTPKTTVTSTTSRPSTYSSQLLETHNPYSINQAFHFSTPLDYHSYYDEYKDPFATPVSTLKTSPTPATITANNSPKPEEQVTEKQIYQQQSSPNYLQSYTPEIHYESEVTNPRYPIYDTNNYNAKTEVTSENNKVVGHSEPIQTDNYRPVYNPNKHVFLQETIEYNPEPVENLTETIINKITSGAENNVELRPNYDQYETSYEDSHYTSSTTSTTTTTRRSPVRSRGRPKYTTTLRPDSAESTTSRVSITRRPLRERRPLPNAHRSRYEQNKITTEKPTRKPLDSSESTTKSSKSRGQVGTRGRIHYKPSENDEIYNKRNKLSGSKEGDLAYQRDVLHQNYPVTLMERMSTVDIEAMTEPTAKAADHVEETYDTENAYAHESISFLENTSLKEQQTETNAPNENTSATKFPSAHNEEFISSYEENNEKQENKLRQITPEAILYATEQSLPNYSLQQEYITEKQEETPTLKDIEITKVGSQETYGTETSDNVVQTTPSYNRVRVRPGVVKQYHQASSTESSRTKSDRKKVQAVTYRPAFDRRRTTMRIEEIEADLKTKQIHSRPDFQDYKHPIYKPDPTTEPAVTTSSTFESTTKRGHFRRRRPVYTTTSTEPSSTKKSSYEVKSRFRGRRPTDKTTERHDSHVETTSVPTLKVHHSRYSQRTRLSERFNKKSEDQGQESEDQDPHHSINIPKYAAPENDEWSPKFTGDSFKPYNPNDILDDSKLSVVDQKTNDGDLDIITARNDYDDILISVTPTTNNRSVKKIPDIPPTLEALVEQTKTTKTDTTDSMSTFETMLEQVMKSLEEQDEDEYSTKVMKHKGGEIGEIPPEKVISSGDEYISRATTSEQTITTLVTPTQESTKFDKDSINRKSHRRGYWKKVKVRPVSSEAIETAESQYYANTVNQLGESVLSSKKNYDKLNRQDKPKHSVTTYKPSFQFVKDYFERNEEFPEDIVPTVDIPKIVKLDNTADASIKEQTEIKQEAVTENNSSPGEIDLGTGSPDPTIMDSMYFSTPTEPTSSESVLSLLDRSDGFSFMDYFFGTSSTENNPSETVNNTNKINNSTPTTNLELTTERNISNVTTTETNYIPEEITAVTSEDNVGTTTDYRDLRKDNSTDKTVEPLAITTSESSFMNPANIMSTSMSTEVSHETEICFRGKCIKTNKDVL